MAMTLRLTPELDQTLGATSERLGISKQQAVTRAVEMYIDAMAERQQVLDAMDALMVQDKKLMERLGIEDVTSHGFRSAFRDWAGDQTNYPRELAEQALAHSIGDQAEQAYRRSDALERRRAMMQDWATYCGSTP